MRNRIIAYMMVAGMALAGLAGCSNAAAPAADEAQKPAVEQTEASSAKADDAQKDEAKKDDAAKSAEATKAEPKLEYVSADELKKELAEDKKENDKDIVLLDVRKVADHQKDGIEGSISADMDAAKGGDMESGKQNMTKALEEAGLMKDGKIIDDDKDLVLVCYSGKSYAEAAHKVLQELGYDMDDVEILEGGMKAWSKAA